MTGPGTPIADRSGTRLLVLRLLVVAGVLTLIGRLWFLQVVTGEDYVRAAEDNRTRTVVTAAPRGEVLDEAGRPMIANRQALVVSVNRSLLRLAPAKGDDVLDRLSPVVSLSPAQLRARITPCGERLRGGGSGRAADGCWSGSPYQSVPVASYDPHDRAALRRVLLVQENPERFPGVEAQLQAVRAYPQGTSAAHVLGYLGPIAEPEVGTAAYAGVGERALVGRSGVEQTYEQQLRGVDGGQELIVDKSGNVTGTAGTTAPVPGSSLVLSIDAQVQAVAERALEQAISGARQRPYYRGGGPNVADSGSVVVMEARTGRLLAMASYPSYDPAEFTGGISTTRYQELLDAGNGQPLLFRATQGAYAPASTFKVVSASAAVMDGQTGFDDRMACPGVFRPTGQQNFAGQGLGTVSLRQAIVRSCDTNFYQLAYDAWLRDGGLSPVPDPKDPTIAMALAYGLGARTGVDLPAESRGLVPTRAWRESYWENVKDDFCQGAENPAFSAERRAYDRDVCLDGNLFRAGQATNLAVGQGEMLVTPLQLASVYASIANGGTIHRPQVAKGLVSPDGRTVTEIAPTVNGTLPVAPDVLAALRDALRGASSEPGGTSFGTFAGSGLKVAGKTGTGEVAGKQDTSWYASFAPFDDPELVVVGLVSQGGTGSGTAAPMVRAVYEGIYGTAGRPAALPGGRPLPLPSAPVRTVGPSGAPS